MKTFKKLLPIAVVVALLTMLLMPATALAAVTVGEPSLGDTLVNATDVTYTVAITTTIPLVATDYINVVFPGDTSLSDVATADVTIAGITITSATPTTQTLKIVLGAGGLPAAAYTLVVKDVINASSAGVKTLTVTTFNAANAQQETGSNTFTLTASTGTGGVTGSVSTANVAPTITSVTLSGTMAPLVSRNLTIAVADNNTLSDIANIKVVIAYDAADADAALLGKASSDCTPATLAIYQWTASVYSVVGPQNTTWAVGAGTTPTLSDPSGSFILAFTPGKVARYAIGGATLPGWDICVLVTDKGGNTVSNQTSVVNQPMAAAAEVKVDPNAVSFGTVTEFPKTGVVVAVPSTGFYTTICLVNKDYALQISSAATWTGAGTLTLVTDAPNANNEFSIKFSGGGARLTTTATTITDHASDGPSPNESETDAANRLNVTLLMDIFNITSPGTYSGAITMTTLY